MSIDKTVIKETKYIALSTFIMGMLTQSVFLIIGKWDYTVLLGNLLSFAVCVGNFLLMGITVQKALTMEESEAKKIVRLSQTLRLWGILAVAVIGSLIPCFSKWTVVIPLLYPRIAIMFRNFFIKDEDGDNK